jgi:hypothetical protein
VLRRLGLARPIDRSHLEHLVDEALGQVSAFIANGNTLVFGELAPLFVRFVRAVEAAGPTGGATTSTAGSTVGDPDPEPTLHLVRTAFRHYATAAGCGDPIARAQHVLAANVAAVLHEQQRLQDDIVAALDAGMVDLGAAARPDGPSRRAGADASAHRARGARPSSRAHRSALAARGTTAPHDAHRARRHPRAGP